MFKPYHKLVYVLGDIHGEFGALNAFINNKIRDNKRIRTLAAGLKTKGIELEVILLQVGDFGFHWPGEDNSGAIKNRVDFLRDGHVNIYFCAGNHEDHNALDALFQDNPQACENNIAEIEPGVYFARFGATLCLAEDVTVLFAGGAESSDKENRTEGLSWWPQEGVSDEDLARLEKIPYANWIISHTAPSTFLLNGSFTPAKAFEPSRGKLATVLERYKPQRWFFGHFHDHMWGTIDGCGYTGLNFLGSGDVWYEKIELSSTSRIMVAGDIHGRFTEFDRLISRQCPAMVMQCGDFGFWPGQGMKLPLRGFRDADDNLVPVYWVDGNHEDHRELQKLHREGHDLEIAHGVHYQPRGSLLTLPDGRTVLFAGGAASIDKDARVYGVDWFPEEIFTEEEFRTLFPKVSRVDIVISHTAPASVTLPSYMSDFYDPSRAVLEAVLQKYRPEQWFCGHYHFYMTQKLLDGACEFVALDCTSKRNGIAFL